MLMKSERLSALSFLLQKDASDVIVRIQLSAPVLHIWANAVR